MEKPKFDTAFLDPRDGVWSGSIRVNDKEVSFFGPISDFYAACLELGISIDPDGGIYVRHAAVTEIKDCTIISGSRSGR